MIICYHASVTGPAIESMMSEDGDQVREVLRGPQNREMGVLAKWKEGLSQWN